MHLECYDHQIFGDHNILNALAVITISYLENLNVANIKEALETFGGVKRRFNETKVPHKHYHLLRSHNNTLVHLL